MSNIKFQVSSRSVGTLWQDLPCLLLFLFSSHHSVLSQCRYGGRHVVSQRTAGSCGSGGTIGWNRSTAELHLTLHGQQLGLYVWIVCLQQGLWHHCRHTHRQALIQLHIFPKVSVLPTFSTDQSFKATRASTQNQRLLKADIQTCSQC